MQRLFLQPLLVQQYEPDHEDASEDLQDGQTKPDHAENEGQVDALPEESVLLGVGLGGVEVLDKNMIAGGEYY